MALRPFRELVISLPFTIDEYGTVGATVDQSKIWADRVRGVIGTAIGERVYRPEFGSRAAFAFFETEQEAQAILETDIRAAFLSYLPLCGLEDVIVTVDPQTRVINAEVSYVIPNSEAYLLQIGIATLNGTQPLSEETTWQRL
jgi:phage baseplate assembly protein W